MPRSRRLALIGLAALWGCSSDGPTGPPVPPPPPPPPPGVPAAMEVADGQTQSGFAGLPVDVSPSVFVTDGGGSPVAGVSVTFTPLGTGSVTDGEVLTDAQGVARVGSWTLSSSPGVNRLRAQADGLPNVTFIAFGQLPPSIYDIVIRFDEGTPTPAQAQAFQIAEATWQAVITSELADVPLTRSAGFCGSSVAIDETIDDLLVLVDLEPIDGPGGILGSAGPCLLRPTNGLPVIGAMRFDTDDLANLEANGTLDDVIVHEIGHILGIGSLWDLFGFLADSAATDTTQAPDPHFTGPLATASFDAIGGVGYTGDKVPVEDQGGPGTRLSHWREAVFDNELMTGFIDPGSNPMSEVTIHSLADMGYAVDLSRADDFALDFSSAVRAARSVRRVQLVDDVRYGPLYMLDPGGGIRLLRPPRPMRPR